MKQRAHWRGHGATHMQPCGVSRKPERSETVRNLKGRSGGPGQAGGGRARDHGGVDVRAGDGGNT